MKTINVFYKAISIIQQKQVACAEGSLKKDGGLNYNCFKTWCNDRCAETILVALFVSNVIKMNLLGKTQSTGLYINRIIMAYKLKLGRDTPTANMSTLDVKLYWSWYCMFSRNIIPTSLSCFRYFSMHWHYSRLRLNYIYCKHFFVIP